MILAAVALPDPTRVDLRGNWEASAYDASFAVLHAAGYRHFELSRSRRLTTETAAVIGERAVRLGLSAAALHAPSLHGPRVLKRQAAILDAARALGASVLVFHVSSIRFAAADGDVRRRARSVDQRRVRALGELAGERGMRLALENGAHPEHADYLMGLVAEVGLPNVGVALDTGHANLRGQSAHELAARLAPKVVHTHLHDNLGRRDEHLTPGRGNIRWPRLLATLLSAGYAGAWCLELKGPPTRGLVVRLQEARKFLEPLVAVG